ncbi:MAG: PEP-CTERM sorting domain-containing protein, partial [Chloroflexi bacterium]|nr:PEP-CTERM sorting domain-containing protein [Chloroflexota bacterium]
SFVVTNLNNESKSFSISVGIPIILPDGETEVFSTLIGSVNDLLSDDGVAVSPVGNAIMTSFVSGPTATNQPLGVDLGTTITEPVAGGKYKFESGLVAGPTGSWNYLALSLDFDLSGPWDNIAGIAYVQIDPYSSGPVTGAPEPGTLFLLGSGLAGLGIVGRWKKKKLV